MRKIITICIIGLFALNVQAQPVKTLKLSDKELLDKIKGGWAGQTIGVVFGAPTEFKFTGAYIQDYQPIPWAEGYVKYWWEKKPGLFDDIYNDCTFVEAFDELGLDCSQEELAKRFAFADYHLAHANLSLIHISEPTCRRSGFPDRSRLHWSDGSGNAAGSIGYRLQSRPHYE